MQDLFLLENELSDEEKLIRDTVHTFAEHEVVPKMLDAYEKGYFPMEFVQRTADLGLLGMSLPEAYGGSNISTVAYGLACQELEWGDSGLRSFVSVQNALSIYPIFTYGSQMQKDKFLKPMCQGKLIGSFGLTEPDVGSDPGAMKTLAKKVDGGWVLNGSKMWITNAPFADLAIVWAKTEEGIRGFIVEKSFSGFTRNEIHNKMSLRASSTGELVFDDCFVPDQNYLPGSDCGLKAPLSCLSQARYGIAWGAMGAARACFEISLSYAKDRKQFEKPITSFQLIQKDFSDMYCELVKAQWMNLQLARLKSKNQVNHTMISLGKMNACREALNIARKARNIMGANGISLDYHVIRHMNNLESVFTYEGTDNIHHLVVGKYLTGLSAFT